MKNYIIIYPNNDLGSNTIIDEYNKLTLIKLRYYHLLDLIFLTILKNSDFNWEFVTGIERLHIILFTQLILDLGNIKETRTHLL